MLCLKYSSNSRILYVINMAFFYFLINLRPKLANFGIFRITLEKKAIATFEVTSNFSEHNVFEIPHSNLSKFQV